MHIIFATFNKEAIILKTHTFQLGGMEKNIYIIFKLHGKIRHKSVIPYRESYKLM